MNEEKIPLLAIVGPTATGKTALSVELALRHHGEIVCADSMQVYLRLDIAAAKPSVEERRGVPHHLMDCWPPERPFSASLYAELAAAAVAEIRARGKLPIIVGGTGLYIDALLTPTVFPPAAPKELREALVRRAREEGAWALHEELARCDPACAAATSANNVLRVVRALEVYALTGATMSEWQARSRTLESPYRALIVGLRFAGREARDERIRLRARRMMEQGLIGEARAAMEAPGGITAAQAIGHKELWPALRGEISLSEAEERLVIATRQYAKRQMTWFRRNPAIHWLDVDGLTPPRLCERAERIMGENGFPEP